MAIEVMLGAGSGAGSDDERSDCFCIPAHVYRQRRLRTLLSSTAKTTCWCLDENINSL